jgi:hypothetical protein
MENILINQLLIIIYKLQALDRLSETLRMEEISGKLNLNALLKYRKTQKLL